MNGGDRIHSCRSRVLYKQATPRITHMNPLRRKSSCEHSSDLSSHRSTRSSLEGRWEMRGNGERWSASSLRMQRSNSEVVGIIFTSRV